MATPVTLTARIRVHNLHEHLATHPDADDLLEDSVAPPQGVMTLLQDLAHRLNTHAKLTVDPVIHPALGVGTCTDITVWLADCTLLPRLFDADEHALGLFNTHNAIENLLDPHEGPMAETLRCVIGWNTDRLKTLILDAAGPVPSQQDLHISTEAWLNTLTHEIAHALLFLKHSGGHSPATIDVNEDDIGHALLDIVTGYGVAPLILDGEPHWSDTMEEAIDDMEEAVEEQGQRLLQSVLQTEDLDLILSWLGLNQTPT